jgi:hypothetical protein
MKEEEKSNNGWRAKQEGPRAAFKPLWTPAAVAQSKDTRVFFYLSKYHLAAADKLELTAAQASLSLSTTLLSGQPLNVVPFQS